jgi:tetratricopeptide (TPR) repeat protein
MLQRAAGGIDSMFPDRPELRIRLLLTVAEINRDLAAFGRADTLARRAVAVADSFSGRSLTTVASRAMLADILRARGELAAADSLMLGALALASELGAPDTTRARLLGARGHILYRLQRYPEAEVVNREALALGTRLGPLFLGYATGNLAGVVDAAGRDATADSLYVRALSIFRAAKLTTHPDYLQALGNRAALLEERWELDSSRAMKEELLPMMQRIYPGGHDRVVIALNNVAFSQLLLGNAAAAESGFARAQALAVRLHAPGHPLAVVPLNNVGRARLLAGKTASAESTFRRVIDQVRASLGHGHPLASIGWLGLGRALGAQDRHQQALAALDSADAIARGALPPTHPRAAEVAVAKGEVLLSAGRPAEAESVARPALEWRRLHLTARDPGVADAAFLVARAMVASDRAAGRGATRAAEVEALCTEAATRYGMLPSRADRRAEVDSSIARWKEEWTRTGG